MSYIIRNVKILWPLGQAVKTPPFHGGNTGSNPVGVIKMQTASKDYSLEAVFHYRLTLNSVKIIYWNKSASALFLHGCCRFALDQTYCNWIIEKEI